MTYWANAISFTSKKEQIKYEIIFFIASLLAILTSSPFGETYLIWYKALQNNYAINDSPGPNINNVSPGNIFQNMVVSGSMMGTTGGHKKSIGLGGDMNDHFGIQCSYIWAKDLNNLSGTVTKATLRAELNDGWWDDWTSEPLCQEGPIKYRCGVISYASEILLFGDVDSIPEDAFWAGMNFNVWMDIDGAEEMRYLSTPMGRPAMDSASVLDKAFIEIDITNQVNWVLSNAGQWAIGLFTDTDSLDNYQGKFHAYGHESSPDLTSIPYNSDSPWTQDGNTTHIILEGTLFFSGIANNHSFSQGIKFILSPTPSDGFINVIKSDYWPIDLAIFDINGKMVQFYCEVGRGWQGNLGNLTNGVYFLKVSHEYYSSCKTFILRK